MLVNSAPEMAPHDAEFQRVIAEVLVRVEDFFRRCTAAGQKNGAIAMSQSADDLGRLLLNTLLGIHDFPRRIRKLPRRKLAEESTRF